MPSRAMTRSKLGHDVRENGYRIHSGLHLAKAIHPKYLAYILQRSFRKPAQNRSDEDGGINDSGLNLTHSRFATLRVALAPLNEQHRIVAKIEKLFSELDKGY